MKIADDNQEIGTGSSDMTNERLQALVRAAANSAARQVFFNSGKWCMDEWQPMAHETADGVLDNYGIRKGLDEGTGSTFSRVLRALRYQPQCV